MAITDKKSLAVKDRTVQVWAEKPDPRSPRSYVFIARLTDHETKINAFIDELGDLQAHVDIARQTVAEQCVSEVEHLEREAEID